MIGVVLLVAYLMGLIDGLLFGWTACDAWRTFKTMREWFTHLKAKKLFLAWLRSEDQL